MNVADIRKRVERQFGDESSVQVTPEDIYRWITDAQMEIVRQNDGLLETTALTSSVAGQSEYSLPSDIMTLHNMKYNGLKIEGRKLKDFEDYIDGWEGPNSIYGPGTPSIFYVWAGTFTLFPTPETAITNGIKIYYTKKPATVAGDLDPITVPDQYHNAIVSFCLQQAYELDEDWAASGNKAAQLQADLNALKDTERWTERITYPTIFVKPEDA